MLKNFASAPAFTLNCALTSTHPCGAVVDTSVELAVPVTEAEVDPLSPSLAEASRSRKMLADATPSNAVMPISS